MCNLYSIINRPQAIGELRARMRDKSRRFPDYFGPIVRNAEDDAPELVVARRGMTAPLQFGGQSVTNIRNVASPHWRSWLSARNRCLVPVTSFCEYADTKPRKTPTWFALSEERPLFVQRPAKAVGTRLGQRHCCQHTQMFQRVGPSLFGDSSVGPAH
jgi:putative SOS response-associated peptidase YedK